MTIDEAVQIATAPPPDPYAATRIRATTRKEIAREVQKSWNRCGSKDVCIAGEHGSSTTCSQPDPQVRKLSCFVVTNPGKGGESGLGYTIAVTVTPDGSYTWGIDRA